MPRNAKVKPFKVEISQSDTPLIAILVEAEDVAQVRRYLADQFIRIEPASSRDLYEAGQQGVELRDATNY